MTCLTTLDDLIETAPARAIATRNEERLRHLERALQDSERRYRMLADAAQDLIFIVDWDSRFQYANTASATRFGQRAPDIIGRRIAEVFPEATAAEMWRQLSIVFATGERQLFECRFDTPGGELYLEASLVPVREEGNAPRTVLGIARDITDRKLLERQFLQAQKMEAMGRLAGGVAHDFNNILTAILGFAELLRDRAAASPDMQADIDEIVKAGERATYLTRHLLAFSRKQPQTPRIVDVATLIADINKMIGRVLGEDIESSTSVAPDTGAISADPGQLEQVLLNLAVNARDAMPKGGRLNIATARTHLDETFARQHPGVAPGRYVSLAISDSGCGMSAEVLSHVFEPFFTTKPVGKGTGLGLATVYGIVAQNHGCVTIQSAPGHGTTVTVYWPQTAASPVTVAPVPPKSTFRGSETVLLVEDEASVRMLIRKTLEPLGYCVIESKDVSDADALAASHPGTIDLLLSDVVMPGMNGPDLAQLIVARRPEIRALYISGFPTSTGQGAGCNRDRVSYLAKPFTPKALAAAVRATLDGLRQ